MSPYRPIAASRNSFESPSRAEYSAATVFAVYSDLKFAPFLLLRMFTIETARTSNRYNLGYTANTVAKIAALYSAQLGDSNELRLAAIGRYGDTPPYRYLNDNTLMKDY